jgi:tRNA(Ile)-lysidine synthase TilS/MesJ
MEGASDDALVQQYIDLKIRPLIKIPDEEVRKYYEQNREKFGGVNYEDAYNNIVNYLTELQINGQLIKQVEMLRADAHIIINLDISGEK